MSTSAEKTTSFLYRGGHKLPHQSQVTRRDLTGEDLAGRWRGKRAMGFVLTDEQHAERVAGKPGTGLPYRYLVYSPDSCALSWTAFYRIEELRAFVDAYGLAIEGSLSPGSTFYVVISEAPVFRDIVEREPDSCPAHANPAPWSRCDRCNVWWDHNATRRTR